MSFVLILVGLSLGQTVRAGDPAEPSDCAEELDELVVKPVNENVTVVKVIDRDQSLIVDQRGLESPRDAANRQFREKVKNTSVGISNYLLENSLRPRP